MIVIIKILGHAGLRVSQVGKNGPLAQFEHFRFETRPAAFRLRIVVTVAPAALRAQLLVVAQQLPVPVATILPALVGVNE